MLTVEIHNTLRKSAGYTELITKTNPLEDSLKYWLNNLEDGDVLQVVDDGILLYEYSKM